MATTDITRHLHRPKHHYVGVRMQQGRTILDSDWNEDVLLEAEDRRNALVELVGCQGSTNAGFTISEVVKSTTTSTASAGYDFSIAAGSFFLGGMRFCLEQSETYLTQQDWLRVDEQSSLMPQPPTAAELAKLPGQVRYDLVYLHAWQQPVSAVEDLELRDRAHGGPDSSTRLRRMRRVEIAANVGTDVPADAFAALFDEVEGSGRASYDSTTAELVSSARLTVSAATEANQSACGPSVTAGYVGYEDQAIRIELRDESHFCWGFCNAAPLYRVRVTKNDPTRVRFITQPRDGERAPQVGQIVEILPWSAKLPNGEKVGELQGLLARVTSAYDSNTRELVIDLEVPAQWLDWLETHTQHLSSRDADGNKRHLYLRVWDRGADTDSAAAIQFRPDETIPLSGTGLQVTFTETGLAGDYWIVAARKATPSTPTPWDLLTGAAPHGTRHFYAPLASIRWSFGAATGGEVVAHVDDARRRIRRIGERGCCTITVGDGTNSNGLVNVFEDAVDALPPEGGRICVLPGNHNLSGLPVFTDRSNIEIVGCGPQSVLLNNTAVPKTSDVGTQGAPILTFTDCYDIRLRSFKIEADARVGIKLGISGSGCQRVWIDNVDFAQTGSYTGGTFALSQSAIVALGVNHLWIRRCKVEIDDEISYTPAVVFGGSEIKLLDSRIQALPLEHPAPNTLIKAMGGVHVLSQSTDVEIAGNIIRGGWGNGISIGHVLDYDTAPFPLTETTTLGMSDIWAAGERGLGEIVVTQLGWVPDSAMVLLSLESGHAWQPCGPVVGLRIHRNEILNMALSGISSAAWRLSDASSRAIFLVAVDLDVARNYIHDNARVNATFTSVFDENGSGLYDFCLGGVCLSGAISPQIRENHILRNHLRDSVTPPAYDLPNVGVGVIAGENVIIEDNRIIDNGIYSGGTINAGLRGGIAVEEVLQVVGYTFGDSLDPMLEVPRSVPAFGSRESALTVRKNEVSQPSGKALWVRRALGPVNVTDNVLQAYGDEADSTVAIDDATFCVTNNNNDTVTLPAQGACVEIIAFGASREFPFTHSTPNSKFVDPTVSATLSGGPVQFCGNTTSLDWTISGGHGASVVISSLDCAVVNDNVMFANMHNTSGLSGEALIGYPSGIVVPPVTQSFLLYHCYVGATGTVQVKGNRIEEGLSDIPFSLVTGGALGPAGMGGVSPVPDELSIQLANLVTWNVCTHCIVAFSPISSTAIVLDNAVISSIEPSNKPCGSGTKTYTANGTSVHVCIKQADPNPG